MQPGLSFAAATQTPVLNLAFRPFSVTKEERNLRSISVETLLGNPTWTSGHLSTVQVQSNLREIDAHAASDV